MRGVKSLKRAMLLAALFGAGIIVGACGYALLKSRHECPRVETAFRLNDPRDAAIFAGQIRTVEWTDVNGTTTRFGVGDGASAKLHLDDQEQRTTFHTGSPRGYHVDVGRDWREQGQDRVHANVRSQVVPQRPYER